jgi:Flp pilus assembly protein TadD
MLFEKIRRTQKPIFILMGLVFALGFALLGVGSSGVDLGGLLANNSGTPSGIPSISSLQAKTQKSPKDAAAWKQLGEAYTAAGQDDQAITAYESYLGLKPNDQTVLAQTASLLEQQGAAIGTALQNAQYDAQWYEQVLVNPINRTRIGAPGSFPLQSILAAPYQTAYQTLGAQFAGDFGRALTYRQTLAKLDPTSSDAHLAVAQDALNARSYAVALRELRTYLTLAPHGAAAAQAKTIIKQLIPLVPASQR